ncbi:unnamed protein product [Heterobilharzia americana]|nr:unnamed protein product [Heterobilharzia americana]
MIYFYISLLALSQLTSGNSFKDCGSSKGSVISMAVIPCDSEPCSLYRGKNSTISIDFKTLSNVTKANAVVHGIIAGLPIPFTLPNPNVCDFVSPSCPLKSTEGKYTYKYAMLTSNEYPPIRVTIKWELSDEEGND